MHASEAAAISDAQHAQHARHLDKLREIARENALHHEIPELLKEIKITAAKGKRWILRYCGHSEETEERRAPRDAGIIAISEHMRSLGYGIKQETHEPCNELQTESSYYMIISW